MLCLHTFANMVTKCDEAVAWIADRFGMIWIDMVDIARHFMTFYGFQVAPGPSPGPWRGDLFDEGLVRAFCHQICVHCLILPWVENLPHVF